MAMTTMPSDVPLLRAEGAFRSVLPGSLNNRLVLDPHNSLVPVNTDLIPPVLLRAFSLPHTDFDQASGYPGSRVPAPFMIPLPFLVDTNQARLATHGASSARENPTTETSLPIYTELPPVSAANVLSEPMPVISAMPDDHTASLDDTKPMHKPRVVWTEELHQRFLRAIDAAGSDEAAVPTVILKLMNVTGLSRDNVASHLQKHRLGLKRGKSRKRRAPATASQKSKQIKAVGSYTDQLHHPEPGTVVNGNAHASAAAGQATHRVQSASAQASKGGNAAAGEGDGQQDCAGSNDRFDCDGNDGRSSDDGTGAGSDDGAGAGSDNRNSACNGGAAELLTQPASCAPGPAQPEPGSAAGNEAADAAQPVLATHAVTDARQHGQGSGGGSRSPDASRSGSNNASKQLGNSIGPDRLSIGVSDVNGSRTAGSGTGCGPVAQRVPPTGDRRGVPESSKPPHHLIQRTGSTPPVSLAVPTVGVPMSLPVMPQVPAANAEIMRAPRLGDA